MIIKGIESKKKYSFWIFPIGMVFLLLILVFSRELINVGKPTSDSVFFCGAEKVRGSNFVSDGIKFGGGATQTKDFVRTGKYSSKLDTNHQYGITYELKDPVPGKVYRIEVWRYVKKEVNTFLVVSSKNAKDFYLSTGKDIETEGTWWRKMELVFQVPKNVKLELLKIYVFKEKADGIVMFDDFKITELDSNPKINTAVFQPQDFYIKIDQKGKDKLESIKRRSISHGLLIKTDEDRVSAEVTTTKGIKKAKVRLKGDWLDHILKGKSSFRIQLDSEDSWLGMQTFSIQHPKTRAMLSEWVYHEFLGVADVLSPKYDFISFYYNNDKPVVYAFEEFFTKNLVESQLRREGPILKFTEDRFWEGMSRSLKNSRKMTGSRNKENALWDSQIKPFKEKKTKNSPVLASSFEIAQNLLQQYRYGMKKTSEVFDIHLFAKYLAITDILQASHALTWHNQRFYFNPVTNLLEPIGYDGFGEYAPSNPAAKLYSENVYAKLSFSTEPIDRLFFDPEFVELYVKYLCEFVDLDFIKKFIAEIEEPLAAREAFLKTEFPNYEFNRETLLKRSHKLRERIIPLKNSIQAYKSGMNKDSMTLELINTHILPLNILHIGNNYSKESDYNYDLQIFPSPKGIVPTYVQVKAPSDATTIYYHLEGLDSIYQSQISGWNTPINWTPRQELLADLESDNKPYVEIGDLILFENKEYLIERPLVLPKNKKVVIEPGAHLKFKNKGFLLSFSAVDMRGDEDEPIVVESLDNNSGGFVVMQAENPSLLRHVLFKNQNTIAYKGWNLTGAVTFYESDVTIMANRFLNNRCEDALNIVRSNFEIVRCNFKNIYGDAFDADFCEGTVENCSFEDIGNDALDFSTSKIDIVDTNMERVGDKAISAGERATIYASNIDVNKSNIGFASKDLSVLTLDNVNITSTSKGFTAYQKKPEFGSATIDLRKHTMTDVKFPFIIEDGSTLKK